jgi:outer membrane protein assembly factor BamE (lipoprotein component of BamABCDE complex)
MDELRNSCARLLPSADATDRDLRTGCKHDTMKFIRAIAVSLVSVWAGCSYAIRPPIIESGRGFSEGLHRVIKKGDSPSEVRSLLGDPYEVDSRGERWRYFMRVRGAEERKLFGLVPIPNSDTVREYEVVVTFTDTRVATITSSQKRLD